LLFLKDETKQNYDHSVGLDLKKRRSYRGTT
jgi:hypothetical protein